MGERRYYPFGETRWSTGSMFTDKLFTGQREMAGLGIYHYGARFYSPNLGRFLSADTIVPGYANPQNLNRYLYVLNNPLRYTDPTGHRPDDGCRTGEGCNVTQQTIIDDLKKIQEFHATTESNKCKAGDKLHCSYAENHPYETATFVITGLVATPVVVDTAAWMVVDAGAVGVAKAMQLYGKAVVLCLMSGICRGLTGMAGGPGLPQLPSRLARVIPENIAETTKTLGAPGAEDVFVTSVDDIAGISSSRELAKRLTLFDNTGHFVKGPFAVLEFDAVDEIATPILRSNLGFTGTGVTLGGANEYTIPNLLISSLNNLTKPYRIIP